MYRDPYIHINLHLSRNISIATVLSLLLHLSLLVFINHQDVLNPSAIETPGQQVIDVSLFPRAPKPPPAITPPMTQQPLAEIKPQPAPRPRPPQIIIAERKKKPERKIRPAPLPQPPKVIAKPKPKLKIESEPETQPAPATPQADTPTEPPALDASQFADMQSYLDAVRKNRQLAGENPGLDNKKSIAQQRKQEQDARMANIRRNLQASGTNGLFHIINVDRYSAQFSFRGWKNQLSYSRREVYKVEVGFDESLELAIIRKMIAIIRRYYSGDFNWESPRYGRIIVLSARLKDNEQLEEFLLQEFFGQQGIIPR